MQALAFWRLAPRQIASDLRRFFGVQIADWHRGRLSSHELLELFGAYIVDDAESKTRTIHIDFPPENGAVAKALRGGERSERDQAIVQCANELAVLRAGFVPNAQSAEYDSRLFLTNARLAERAEERKEDTDTAADEPGSLYSLWQEV